MLPPMGYAYYANMTDEDLDAIIAYLSHCRRNRGLALLSWPRSRP